MKSIQLSPARPVRRQEKEAVYLLSRTTVFFLCDWLLLAESGR